MTATWKFPRNFPRRHAAWLLPALLIALAGCADRMAQLRRHMADDSPIYVIYLGGTVITRIADGFAAQIKTPPEYRAVAAAFTKTLRESLRGRRVFELGEGRPDADTGDGLRAIVLVGGGYVCEGRAPEYSCALTMQTRVTFRAGRGGKIVGNRLMLVGHVSYGRHPLEMPPVRGGNPTTGAIDRRIKEEIPPTMILGPLVSVTQDGLAQLLKELQIAPSGAPPRRPGAVLPDGGGAAARWSKFGGATAAP